MSRPIAGAAQDAAGPDGEPPSARVRGAATDLRQELPGEGRH